MFLIIIIHVARNAVIICNTSILPRVSALVTLIAIHRAVFAFQ
jgi:hypothetical protein